MKKKHRKGVGIVLLNNVAKDNSLGRLYLR